MCFTFSQTACLMSLRYDEVFSDLHTAVERVQAHLQQEIEARTNEEVAALCCLQLAVHEWMGNLVRHAQFGERFPEVHVRVWQQDGQLRCAIEDNSEGFDLDEQLKMQERETPIHALPEGGMGLRLLQSSTERAEYGPVSEQQNRLDLSVSLDE